MDALVAQLTAVPSPMEQPPSPQEEPTAPVVGATETAVPIVAVLDSRELKCMAQVIYFEARGESARGQAAVGYVVLNRVRHSKFPDSICGVVYERSRRICQFSWVCDGHSNNPRNKEAYAIAERYARAVMLGDTPNPIGNALFFDGYVRSTKRKAGHIQIGGHRFYERYASR
jgi:N-acetylmuramoyl-L-alanine amidase